MTERRAPRRRTRYVTTSVSYPEDLAPLITEVEEDWGTLSKFLRVAVDQYLQQKGAAGARDRDIGLNLLRAKGQQVTLEATLKAREKERLDQLIEEREREHAQAQAAGIMETGFTDPEALVAHYRPRIADNAPESPVWRNLAERHGLRYTEVLSVVQRHASQTRLPHKQKREGSS